jgi:ATPase subunit of ABC transporter with duplicated ATPase domains
MWGFFMITLQNISKTIITKTLFEEVSFSLSEKHKIGLVGPNGSGKTTLMRIILGEEDPDSGQVLKSNEVLGYLPQEIAFTPQQSIASFFWEAQTDSRHPYNISKILARVGLDYLQPEGLVANLSGGEKMKLGLAQLLLRQPTTLLLDEPTNNLDLQALSWLETFVRDFSGKVLVISHDRYFLDRCVNKIIEIDPFSGAIEEYGGGYTDYLRQKKERQENQATQYQLQQNKEKKMKDWIHLKQQQLQAHPNPKVAKQLQAMKTRLNREIVQQGIDRPQQYQSFRVQNLGNGLHQKKSVLSLHDLHIVGLLTCPQLDIFGGDRVLLTGKNGSGKTTFLRQIMAAAVTPVSSIEIGPGVSMGYFSQDHDLLQRQSTVIQEFQRLVGGTEAQARLKLGAFLFPDRTVYQNIQQLSLGERARLHLAILMNQNHNFLILDEPTNHLDLPSREVLESTLKRYEGGFMVVSHDRFFIRQIGLKRILQIKNQELLEVMISGL